MENIKYNLEIRKIHIPNHRFRPLREHWMKIYASVTEKSKLEIRMNLNSRNVELKTKRETENSDALQRAADFVEAFAMGFEIQDAISLLRLDDLFIETFEIKDVKTLKGEHMSRSIGRISGRRGRVKATIENSTRTRIVILNTKIHILGTFSHIRLARDALCQILIGSPPGKVCYKSVKT
jgi:RNA-binding protein PNO1